MMTAHPIHRNVPGAPFHISAKVVVSMGTDETFDEQYLRKVAEVISYEYSGGCGQSFPGDPMIGVGFPDGKIEYFWHEELEVMG